MSARDPRVTLCQIRDAAREAQSMVEGYHIERLRADRIRTLAFERCFEILGEGIKRLPEHLRDQYPQVDWKKAAGARDVVSHGYDALDHRILLDAVRLQFPLLLETLDGMIADLGGPPS